MVRVLVLAHDEPKRTKRFTCLVMAVYAAGNKSTPRNRQTIRAEAEILDALDAVSDPVTDEPTMLCTQCGGALSAVHMNQFAAAEKRRPKSADQILTLSESAYGLLGHYLETTPWLPSAARQALDVMDWFDAAGTQE